MTRKIVFICIFIVTLIGFCSCSNKGNFQPCIKELIQSKIMAIEEKNIDKYLETVDKSNAEYYREQKRWIIDIASNNIENYYLEIINMEPIDEENIIAKLKQTYSLNGNDYSIEYDGLYIKTNDEWKDSGINFCIKETDNFVFKYIKEDEKIDKVIKQAEKAMKTITERYGRTSDNKIQVKVYSDRELLRQSTKLSIEFQFTGWYEMGEALKVYSGREIGYSYEKLFMHELTHKLTMEDTNDNMPYWFAEGLAMYFANFYIDGGNPIDKDWYCKDDFNLSIMELEKINLETLTEQFDRGVYYGVSGMIVQYIVQQYGQEKLLSIIDELGKYEFKDNLLNINFREDNQKKFRQVLIEVFNKDIEEISNEWIEWLKNY